MLYISLLAGGTDLERTFIHLPLMCAPSLQTDEATSAN